LRRRLAPSDPERLADERRDLKLPSLVDELHYRVGGDPREYVVVLRLTRLETRQVTARGVATRP
jgi:hypothetical protein